MSQGRASGAEGKLCTVGAFGAGPGGVPGAEPALCAAPAIPQLTRTAQNSNFFICPSYETGAGSPMPRFLRPAVS